MAKLVRVHVPSNLHIMIGLDRIRVTEIINPDLERAKEFIENYGILPVDELAVKLAEEFKRVRNGKSL